MEMDPPSADINKIEDGLYLSSREVAQSEEMLERFGITHILTVDSWPIKVDSFKKPENYVFFYLCKNDEENVDLLSHFGECIQFIKSGDTVLVHCFVGVSRSATIVLAYLMDKHRITFEEAYARLRARRFVGPNDGFINQLRLFERMGWSIDKDNRSYQLLMLSSIVFEVGCHMGFNNIPEDDRSKVRSLLFDDKGDVYCHHCRYPLTSSQCIITHEKGEPVSWKSLLAFSKPKSSKQAASKKACSEVFMVPSKSIIDQCHGVAGKIICPKCTNNVGRYGWLGVLCDCGAKMEPGFALSCSKIDLFLLKIPLELITLPQRLKPSVE